ncbi:TlpA family protein disulfide reductase [Neolewinella persica]|uniref:TlpA family protein disulfide reductase n=1 Tax=Neolewinella persica TaxID=70998 RepID=UPI00039D824B|nr:hypothetical protein [Neolewinella persica]
MSGNTSPQAVHSAVKLPVKPTSITFIKKPNGLIIDRLSVRTSLGSTSFDVNWSGDSLTKEVNICLPVDVLFIEAFAADRSFGAASCWVDRPRAEVYLSVIAGRTRIDAVGISSVDAALRVKLLEVNTRRNYVDRKAVLARAIMSRKSDLTLAPLLEAYLNLPNLSIRNAISMHSYLNSARPRIHKHPYLAPLKKRLKQLAKFRKHRLLKYEFKPLNGRPQKLIKPLSSFIVLNFYRSYDPQSRKDHQEMQNLPVLDSLLREVPIISIAQDDNEGDWEAYLSENDFEWPHWLEVANKHGKASEELAIFEGPAYVLLDENFFLHGIYPDLSLLAQSLYMRTQEFEPERKGVMKGLR